LKADKKRAAGDFVSGDGPDCVIRPPRLIQHIADTDHEFTPVFRELPADCQIKAMIGFHREDGCVAADVRDVAETIICVQAELILKKQSTGNAEFVSRGQIRAYGLP
jgi:uncharacterized protein (DUF2237 family)